MNQVPPYKCEAPQCYNLAFAKLYTGEYVCHAHLSKTTPYTPLQREFPRHMLKDDKTQAPPVSEERDWVCPECYRIGSTPHTIIHSEECSRIKMLLHRSIMNPSALSKASAIETPNAGSIEATLAERGSRYGEFAEHARITQNIKAAMADSPNWKSLSPAMKESLEMVAHKAGRILNGDSCYIDSWHDMVGYIKLVEDILVKAEKEKKEEKEENENEQS